MWAGSSVLAVVGALVGRGGFADMESISMPEDQAALHGGYKRGVTGGRATSANKSSSAALAGSGLGASGGLGDGNKMFKDAPRAVSSTLFFEKKSVTCAAFPRIVNQVLRRGKFSSPRVYFLCLRSLGEGNSFAHFGGKKNS